MTYEKANHIIDDISWVYNGERITAQDRDECRELCHKALEKQIRKKPIVTYMTDNWKDGIKRPRLDACKCPNCGSVGTVGDDEYIRLLGHCVECGQAIDWSVWPPFTEVK